MTSSTEAEGHKKSKLKGTKIIGSLTGGLPPCREGTIKLIGTIDTPICWPDVKKHRLLLCGRQLKHAQLCKQLAKWIENQGMKMSSVDIDTCVYRLRNMMSHLRDFSRDGKRPPKSYEGLCSVLAKIIVAA